MKMLIFSPYYPPHIGGLESHADEFNKYLSQKGTSVVVFTPRLPEEAPEKEERYNGVKIIRFPAFEIISNYPLPKFWTKRYRELKKEIKGENFDIVISRTRFFFTSLMALFFAKSRKVRWIHIEHGSDFVKSGGKLSTSVARIYDYTLGKLVLRSADRVVANSKASADFCRKLAGNLDCEVIYRGVEIEKIESVKPALDIKSEYLNDTIITFIGRLIDGKGVQDLIRAVKDIEASYKLFIVGDGPEWNKLEKLAKDLGLQHKVIFFGHMAHEEAIGILKISDIFVNPSYTEGLPSSVIEAALCKVPVIVTNVGGTPEIITDNQSGCLVDPNDILKLKNKLEILINDENLRKKLENSASEEIKNKFSWKNSIEKYLEIFSTL